MKKVKKGYVAMNAGEFDLEDMSFFNTKKKAKKYFGNSQKIVKVRIEFEIEGEKNTLPNLPNLGKLI